MRTLQTLLVILDGQKLGAGYLTPAGTGTALETMIDLKRQIDTGIIGGSPYQPPGTTLFSPAWISSLRGQNAIYLADVSGNLNKANGPAYVFA